MSDNRQWFSLTKKVVEVLDHADILVPKHRELVIDHVVDIEPEFIDCWSIQRINVISPELEFAVRPGFYLVREQDKGVGVRWSLFLVDLQGEMHHHITTLSEPGWAGSMYLEIKKQRTSNTAVMEIHRQELQAIITATEIQDRHRRAEFFSIISRLRKEDKSL